MHVRVLSPDNMATSHIYIHCMVAQRYEYYFQVVKTIFYEQMQGESKILFQHKKIKFISSSYHVMFFLLYGQKLEQVNREHIIPRENTHVFHMLHIFSYLNYIVKIWKVF